MPSSRSLLDPGGLVLIGSYLLTLLLVGWVARRARKENSPSDFFLAGRSFGVFVLFLTLYATQYSGTTLIGYAGTVYRRGFVFFVSVTFFLAIIAAYLLFAPRLYRDSRRHGFVTTGDYLQFRYQHLPLTVLTTFIFLVALAFYILVNLKAIGYLVETGTGGRIPFTPAIVVMSLIMVTYESLGGMRSVAWTDAIQGIILLAGCLGVFAVAMWSYGGPAALAMTLQQQRPEFWNPPDGVGKRLWLSTIMLVFFSVAIYPHAIQRIYAAKSEATLKRSFQWMLAMPFLTTLPVILVALMGAAQFPGLDRDGSEQVLLFVLNDLGQQVPAFRPLLLLFLAAGLAAIMSTVDSALLALSALFTSDIYARFRPESALGELAWAGKVFSWLLMGVMVLLACNLPQTLWRLTELKLEILCQAAPAIFLGVHLRTLPGAVVFTGAIAGLAVLLGLQAIAESTGDATFSRPGGFHAGIWGLTVNFLVICCWSVRRLGCQDATKSSRG